ncbi:MAG: ribonuclease E/G [Marivibrio sp.]|uniref:ribonuclease E/G n=1 Tax=Marivibrio sp. TaxID=2039719 RepID=UPI0032EF2C2E
MSEPAELYLDSVPGERRAALVGEDGRLLKVSIDRDGRASHLETIVRARVVRVDKQTGAAFFDLGPAGEGMLPKAGKLTEGAAASVQVVRDAHAAKGPALTRNYQLAERYLAWTFGRRGVEVARALGQGKRRAELEEALAAALDAADVGDLAEGLLLRAPALGADAKTLERDLRRLAERRAAIRAAEERATPPATLETPPGFLERAVRDAPAGARVATDDRALHQRLKARVQADWPDLAEGIAFFDPARGALFDSAGVSDALAEATARTVDLVGGGRLVIDRTEALIAIDVDGGGSADGGGLKEEAVFRLNRRAVEEAARQIRLRNLSGLIVIDCVTLKTKGRIKALVEHLRAKVKADPVKTDVLGATAAGLIEVTRQRTAPALDELMDAPAGAPRPAADAQAVGILRAALALKGPGAPVACASKPVQAALKGPLAEAKADVDRRLGRPLEVRDGADTVPPDVILER